MQKEDFSVQKQGFICDSHSHLLDYNNKDQINEVLQRCFSEGVEHIMTNACTEKDFLEQSLLVREWNQKKENFLIPSYGLHPCYLNQRSENWFEILKGFIQDQQDSFYLIGEIGLDLTKENQTPLKEQIEIFQKQVELAIQLNKTISVHSLRAQKETFKTLRDILNKNDLNPPLNIIFHSYTGGKEHTKNFLKLKANTFFSVSLLAFNDLSFVQHIPLSQILVETDSPYQINDQLIEEIKTKQSDFQPLQNQNLGLIQDKFQQKYLNQPYYLKYFIHNLAQIYKINQYELTVQLYQNSLKAFMLFKK